MSRIDKRQANEVQMLTMDVERERCAYILLIRRQLISTTISAYNFWTMLWLHFDWADRLRLLRAVHTQ
jgi:hypothetical protein